MTSTGYRIMADAIQIQRAPISADNNMVNTLLGNKVGYVQKFMHVNEDIPPNTRVSL